MSRGSAAYISKIGKKWGNVPYESVNTVEPVNSKLVNSKLRVNSKLFLAAFQSVYNINHLLNSKLLAIVNLLLFLKKFTITRFDCTFKLLQICWSLWVRSDQVSIFFFIN